MQWLTMHDIQLTMDDLPPHDSRSCSNQTDLESDDRYTVKSHISEQMISLYLSSSQQEVKHENTCEEPGILSDEQPHVNTSLFPSQWQCRQPEDLVAG